MDGHEGVLRFEHWSTPPSVEVMETARLRAAVLSARAALDEAYRRLGDSVARAVVDAGVSWAWVADVALLGDGGRDTARRAFGARCEVYRLTGLIDDPEVGEALRVLGEGL